jgi:hypothetical protein
LLIKYLVTLLQWYWRNENSFKMLVDSNSPSKMTEVVPPAKPLMSVLE